MKSGNYAKKISAAVAGLYLISIFYQVYLSIIPGGGGYKIQEEILLIAKHWTERNPNKDIINFSTPIGPSTQACRFWAFDYIRENCFGLIIYTNKKLDMEWISKLAEVISYPCKYKNDYNTEEIRKELRMSDEMRCSASYSKNIRIGVSVEKIHSSPLESGGVKNDFEKLESFIFEGKI